jgi:hypothetical protein
MYVPEIIEIKEALASMKNDGLIAEWELPYETLLTRRSAAIFFVTPSPSLSKSVEEIFERLSKYENFSYRANHEKKLSKLSLRITFSKEEVEKNKLVAQS